MGGKTLGTGSDRMLFCGGSSCSSTFLSIGREKYIHAWKKCAIWGSYSREMLILEGNLCHFERKFIIIISMDISDKFTGKKKSIFLENSVFFTALSIYSSINSPIEDSVIHIIPRLQKK